MLDTVSTYDRRVPLVAVPTGDGDERLPRVPASCDEGEVPVVARSATQEVSAPEDATLLTYWVAG